MTDERQPGPVEDDDLHGICFCPTPYHTPFCRIGVMLARLERPANLFRVTKIC